LKFNSIVTTPPHPVKEMLAVHLGNCSPGAWQAVGKLENFLNVILSVAKNLFL
jgi:hypothetical protein